MPGTDAHEPFAEGARRLAERDAVVAGLVERFGLPRTSRPRSSGFAALVRAIIYQQLAGAAAAAIHARFLALIDGPPTAEAVMQLPDDQLRSAGLSGNKTAAITDLAAHAADGRIVFRGLARRSDAEVVERLTRVRGIGEWTAPPVLDAPRDAFRSALHQDPAPPPSRCTA